MKKKILMMLVTMGLLLSMGNAKAEEYSEKFQKFFPNGVYSVPSRPIENDQDLDVFLYGHIFRNVFEGENSNYGIDLKNCNSTYTSCDLTLSEYDINAGKEIYKETHNITFTYNYNQNISKELNKYLEIAKTGAEATDEGWAKLYTLEDLNLINYYSSITSKESLANMNNAINYVSKLRKEFDNSNVTYSLDTRAGDDIPFKSLFFGYFIAYYNGIAYGYVDPIGVQKLNVIYVPTDTGSTKEERIEAAKKRIEEYLGKSVEISLGGLRQDYDFSNVSTDPNYVYDWSKIGDETKMGDYYYNIKINNNTYEFVIINDSSKMQNIDFTSKDLLTSVSVSSKASIPLDTLINVDVIKDNEAYKKILNTDNIYTLDIKLNSNSTNKNIERLENGKFLVSIPIPEYLQGQNLVASFITEDGKIETHEVTVQNNIAYFETDHFSTYSLSSLDNNQSEVNPATGDNIITYALAFTVSIISLGFILIKIKEKRN